MERYRITYRHHAKCSNIIVKKDGGMMGSVYEVINSNDQLPFEISLKSIGYVPKHWHKSIEIILVLKGSIDIIVNQDRRLLKEGELLVVNSCHVHEIIGVESNIIASTLVPVTYLKPFIPLIETISFECDSQNILEEKKEALFFIRLYLVEIIQLKSKGNESLFLEMNTKMMQIFTILMKQFKVSFHSKAIQDKHIGRMMSIINYIDEHYQETVSLQDIANREYLSIPYLSKFFHDNMGQKFQNYITSVRLKYAVEELMSDLEKTITDIANNHGFPNTKSFYHAFKSRYMMTPNEYRKVRGQSQVLLQNERESKSLAPYYQSVNTTAASGVMEQYLQRGNSSEIHRIESYRTEKHHIDLSSEKTKIAHTWKTIMTIGRAKEGLYQEIQEQLRLVQHKTPFQFIRFHGIFDDEMMVYSEDSQNNPRFHFRYIDQLFDFLLSIQLKPFVELGFMPKALASDQSKTVFYYESIISPPKTLEKWCLLVESFVKHCFQRYGQEEVESWRFEFWNEPEFYIFWSGSEAEYREFYRVTYETIKRISARIQIGAPGRIITAESTTFNDDFFAYCHVHHCYPDFIPLHFYPHDFSNGKNDINHLLKAVRVDSPDFFGDGLSISLDPNSLQTCLMKEKQILDKQGLSELPIYLTEWNSTYNHRDLTNDTLYKAAYIVKNLIDNLDQIAGFGYWLLSDNVEETFASADLFHGGLGLFTHFGIPKAAYLAYTLLHKLGDELIEKGDGFIVTASKGSYQLLLYNYSHFDELYRNGDKSFIHQTNRYHVFTKEDTLHQLWTITGLEAGQYRVVTHTVNREHGSSYDDWVAMGAPEFVTTEEIAYLKAKAQTLLTTKIVQIDESFLYETFLEPHAIQLVELTLYIN